MGNKSLTKEAMLPVLDKLRDHLIGKNVASDIAAKLCDSVAAKLEGKVSTSSCKATLFKLNYLFSLKIFRTSY